MSIEGYALLFPLSTTFGYISERERYYEWGALYPPRLTVSLVLVELPLPGKDLKAGVACLFIETMTATEEVFAPVSGSVIARNEALQKKPELVNSDPFGEGWLLRVKLSVPTEADCLMDAAAYASYTSA